VSKEEDQAAQLDPSSLGSERAGGKEMETRVAAIVCLRCLSGSEEQSEPVPDLGRADGAQPMNRFNSERMDVLPLRVCEPFVRVVLKKL
jgi:hypothetical protein